MQHAAEVTLLQIADKSAWSEGFGESSTKRTGLLGRSKRVSGIDIVRGMARIAGSGQKRPELITSQLKVRPSAPPSLKPRTPSGTSSHASPLTSPSPIPQRYPGPVSPISAANANANANAQPHARISAPPLPASQSLSSFLTASQGSLGSKSIEEELGLGPGRNRDKFDSQRAVLRRELLDT